MSATAGITANAQRVGDTFLVFELYYRITQVSPNKEAAVTTLPNYPLETYEVMNLYIFDKVYYKGGEYKVTAIDYNAFAMSRFFTSAIIPNSITSIRDRAFWDCHDLTSVTIPNSVTSIEYSAFRDCDGLTSITSKIEDVNSVTMEDDVFRGVDKKECILYVPAGKVDDYKNAEQWKEFINIKEISNATTSIKHTKLTNPIAVIGKNITISQVAGKNVKLYSLSGQMLYNIPMPKESVTLTVAQAGVYIVQVGNATRKVVVK